MLYIAIGLFALAAVLGLINLKNWAAAKHPPRPVVYSHGLFAATGLVLLLVNTLRQPTQALTTSLIFFVLAALGGFFLFYRDINGKVSPLGVAILHGLLAVTGFIILLTTVL